MVLQVWSDQKTWCTTDWISTSIRRRCIRIDTIYVLNVRICSSTLYWEKHSIDREILASLTSNETVTRKQYKSCIWRTHCGVSRVHSDTTWCRCIVPLRGMVSLRIKRPVFSANLCKSLSVHQNIQSEYLIFIFVLGIQHFERLETSEDLINWNLYR